MKDFVSENVGNYDGFSFCGARNYVMDPMPSFLEFDPLERQLTLMSNDEADVGIY